MSRTFRSWKTVAVALAAVLLPAVLLANTAHAQQRAPQLRRIGPATVAAGSPTFSLRVEGRNFDAGARVLLDGVDLPSPRIPNARLALVDIPESVTAAPGTHTIQVINPDGQATGTATLTVVEQDPGLNIVLSGNAAEEDQGTDFQIDITGTGFRENSVALVSGFNETQTEFISRERLRIVIPTKYTNQPARVAISVRNPGQAFSNTEIFFVVPRAARVTELEPTSVTVGNEDFELRVFGNNLKPDAKVVINGVVLEPTNRRQNRLDVIVPGSLRATPRQLVVRIEQEGIQSTDETLAVTPSEDPFIYAIGPHIIRQGTTKMGVTVIGANFTVGAEVLVDGQTVRVRNRTRRRLVFVATNDLLSTVGTHTVQVRDSEGRLSNVGEFHVMPDVMVSTLAGSRVGSNPNDNCVSREEALFRRPRRLTFGPDGLIYLTDQQNHQIRTLNPDTGEVCTIAGTGQFGYVDTGDSTRFPEPAFSYPNGLAVDDNGTIYVSENGNNVIRRIRRNQDGTVTVDTFAGTFRFIEDRDRQDKLNATKAGQIGFRDGALQAARMRTPDDMVMAPDGSIYFTDPTNHAVRRIRFDGGTAVVETVAGNGVPGFADGIAENARFRTPMGIAISPDGTSLFVTDFNNHRIRRIDLATRRVETVAGTGTLASDDGPVGLGTFAQPIGITIDADGTLYVTEFAGNRVRRVDLEGNVTTVAGSDRVRFRDGTGVRATFNLPRDILIDPVRRVLYVADYENSRIRQIDLP